MKKIAPYMLSIFIGSLAVFSYTYGFWLTFSQVTIGPVVMLAGPVILISYILIIVFLPKINKELEKEILFHYRVSLLAVPIGFFVIQALVNFLD